jgi:sodium-dependent dicarboxylate transporter 2/3/5
MTSLDWIGAGSSPRLLDWDSVQHKLPWNVVILLGSGFALAEAAQVHALTKVNATIVVYA